VSDKEIIGGLVTAAELRRYITTCRWPRENGYTHERIAEILGLSAGFVGMVISGAREPSKAFLEAAGFERVVFYRLKRTSRRNRKNGGYV
jgi:hypothetical protein